MPDVPRLPSVTPILLYQRVRLAGKIFHLDYGGLRTDRISEVAPVHKVCWTLWNLVRVHLCLANMSLPLREHAGELPRGRDGRRWEITFFRA